MSCNKIINYFSFVLLVVIIGTQAYSLYYTRNDSFPGVWITRSTIVILIASFLNCFIFSAFLHRFTMDQLSSCTTVQYFRFRWYVFLMAAFSLTAIPVYFAILHQTNQNRLLILLASQIQVSLFSVLLCIAMDSLSRYLYLKQLAANNQQQEQPQTAETDAQFGYFSPKTKTASPQKTPFESSKIRYAR